MTINEAEALCKVDLDTLRLRTDQITVALRQADNSRWIGSASRKELLAEIIRLFADGSIKTKAA